MEIENKIQNISKNGFRITIPPFDLGIPQIIHLNNTITLSWVDFNMFRSHREAKQRGVGCMQCWARLPNVLRLTLWAILHPVCNTLGW